MDLYKFRLGFVLEICPLYGLYTFKDRQPHITDLRYESIGVEYIENYIMCYDLKDLRQF